eukprot:12290173-Prorocentrum_lima.AAC.1
MHAARRKGSTAHPSKGAHGDAWDKKRATSSTYSKWGSKLPLCREPTSAAQREERLQLVQQPSQKGVCDDEQGGEVGQPCFSRSPV